MSGRPAPNQILPRSRYMDDSMKLGGLTKASPHEVRASPQRRETANGLFPSLFG